MSDGNVDSMDEADMPEENFEEDVSFDSDIDLGSHGSGKDFSDFSPRARGRSGFKLVNSFLFLC